MTIIQTKIYIIIATSKKRTNLLINRSLKSIYYQTKINIENVEIVIIDDNLKISENEFSMEYKTIENSIKKLRNKFGYKKTQFKTHLLKNTKTQFKSGTGAWNTGIEFIEKQRQNENSFTAILDDDDEYKNNYLQECIKQLNSDTYAIFAPIIWKEKEFKRIHYIKKEELTPKHFFIGNPGVQGSNMFFKSDILEKIGGFDENLPSTTDRDLMIRFLDYKNNFSNSSIIILNKPLVIHYATGNDRVTDNKILKKEGLDIFYRKYKTRFSEADFRKSISRAEKFFQYKYIENRAIVIAMPLKNGAKTIKRAVRSIFNQKNLKRDLILIIGNDNSTDSWEKEIQEYISDNRIIIKNIDFGKLYKVRNYLHSYIREEILNADYIGRLDADDYITNDTTLSVIEKIMDKYNPDVIISGNKLTTDNKLIKRVNIADEKLFDFNFLRQKLEQMSKGKPNGELPSCNTFIKPSVVIDYKNIESAEDHWFTVDLLLNKDRYKIYIANKILYSVYSLSGNLTNINRTKNKYLQSRKLLLQYFLDKISVKNKENTYCSDLWESITVNKYGDVYSCCLLKPEKIGNINDGSLSELINNKIAIKSREKSLAGKLECYRACTLVNKNISKKYKSIETSESNLKTIHISCSESCNIQCIMCNHPKRHKEDPVELSSSQLVDKIDFGLFDNIIIQGGEPLYINSCVNLINHLNENHFGFTLLTNGLLINDDFAKQLALNAKNVSISINAATQSTHEAINRGSDFYKILKNIQMLISYREKFKTELILYGRMTLVTQNLHEIPLFIKKYKILGFDKINFGFDNPSVPNLLNKNINFKEKLKREINAILMKVCKDDIDLKRLKQLELI